MKLKSIKTFGWLPPITIAAFVFFSSSCNYLNDSGEAPVAGSGVVVEEIRDVAAFHSVETRGSCNVYFVKGAVQELRLVGEENILPLINTWVRQNGTLIIEPTRCYTTNTELRACITMQDVQGFRILGSGCVISESVFSCNRLNLDIIGSGNIEIEVRANSVYSGITGSGNIYLAGRTDYHNIRVSGSGNLEAMRLDTSITDILVSGSGTCHVFVRDVLNIQLNGSGDVYYSGSPAEVNVQINGSGCVIKQ